MQTGVILAIALVPVYVILISTIINVFLVSLRPIPSQPGFNIKFRSERAVQNQTSVPECIYRPISSNTRDYSISAALSVLCIWLEKSSCEFQRWWSRSGKGYKAENGITTCDTSACQHLDDDRRSELYCIGNYSSWYDRGRFGESKRR